MFRGGDYIDNPRFYNNESLVKNTLDVSVSKLLDHSAYQSIQDITGATAKTNYPPLQNRAARDTLGVADINAGPHGKPPMY